MSKHPYYINLTTRHSPFFLITENLEKNINYPKNRKIAKSVQSFASPFQQTAYYLFIQMIPFSSITSIVLFNTSFVPYPSTD